MTTPKINLSEIDCDFSDAVVEAASASSRDFELKMRGVEVPGRKLSRVLLRFEGIEGFDQVWYELNTKVQKRGRHERHSPWPLRLPAGLKTLIEVKTRGKLRKFQFAVAEEHFKGRKKPLEFRCKRFCITDLKGKSIAGDESKISSFRNWKTKDFQRLADRFAKAIEKRRFQDAHPLLESSFARSKPLTKMTAEFERLMNRDRNLPALFEELGTKKTFEHFFDVDLESLDAPAKRVDADEVVAVVLTGFLGWFCVTLVIYERDGELQIGYYSIDRDWEDAYFG